MTVRDGELKIIGPKGEAWRCKSDRTRGLCRALATAVAVEAFGMARQCRALATAAAIEAFGMAHHVVETDAAERFSEFLLGG